MSSLWVDDGYRYPDGNLYPCLLTWWLMDTATLMVICIPVFCLGCWGLLLLLMVGIHVFSHGGR